MDPLQSSFIGGWPDLESSGVETLSAQPLSAPVVVTQQVSAPDTRFPGSSPETARLALSPAVFPARLPFVSPSTSSWVSQTTPLVANPPAMFPDTPTPGSNVDKPQTIFPSSTPIAAYNKGSSEFPAPIAGIRANQRHATPGGWTFGAPNKTPAYLAAPMATHTPFRRG